MFDWLLGAKWKLRITPPNITYNSVWLLYTEKCNTLHFNKKIISAKKNSTSNHILPQWTDKTKVAPWLPCSFCRQRIKEMWRQDGLQNHNIDTNFHNKQQIISKAKNSNFLGWCHVVWYIGKKVAEELAATVYREVQVWCHIPEGWNFNCTSVKISYLA